MAKADGDERPIGQIRSAMHSMLILRAADHGLGGVSVQLIVNAALEGLSGRRPGWCVAGFALITAAHLRELLRRVEAIGLTAPAGGSLTFALTDQRGQLLATVTAAELTHLARSGCPQHPDAACDCAVLGVPDPVEEYEPRAAQRRFVTTRDRRCRMPNCGQRVGWADLDQPAKTLARKGVLATLKVRFVAVLAASFRPPARQSISTRAGFL